METEVTQVTPEQPLRYPPDARLIPLSDVYVGERRRKEMGDVADLAKDIRENGLLQPPVVRPPNEIERELGVKQPWVLIAGGRRFASFLRLGLMVGPFLTRETMDELHHRILELHENLKRKQLTTAEEVLMTQEIMQLREAQAEMSGKKITQAEVAIELGITPATLSRNLQAADAIKANPGLKKSKSRKSIIRAGELQKQGERLTAQQVMAEQGSKDMQFLQNNVVTADARDWLRKREMHSVDLVLSDPPFGIDYFTQGQKNKVTGSHSEYQDDLEYAKDVLTDVVPQWARILRETGWLLCFLGEETYGFTWHLLRNCCNVHFDYRWGTKKEDAAGHTLDEVRKLRRRCAIAVEENSPNSCNFLKPAIKPWIWHRPNSRNKPRYPDQHAQNVYETILVCNMGRGRLNFPCSNILTFDAEYGEDRIHENQKSVPLAHELTRRVCSLGDTVLDSFFGSGALLAGAAKAGMYVEGCDLNETMRGPALGLIAKNRVPVFSRGKQASEERYLAAMNRGAPVIDDDTQEEE